MPGKPRGGLPVRLVGLAALASLFAAAPLEASDRYRVEVLVFRHTNTEPTPAEVTSVRHFQDAFRLDQGAMPEAPVRVTPNGDTFKSLWRRLDRLFGYEPLALVTWEQTQADYHPPVRIHDQRVLAEMLRFPSREVALDLGGETLFDDFVAPLYQLDGTVQLRRSRFLHLDLDLEFRIDDEAWGRVYPSPRQEMFGPLPGREQASWQGAGAEDPAARSTFAQPEAEALRIEVAAETAPADATGPSIGAGSTEQEAIPTLLPLHRLFQSRQIRSNEMNYFDTPYLGVLARVTPIEND